MESDFWQLNDFVWLRRAYLRDDRTQVDIATEVGCHPRTVVKYLAYWGLRKHPTIDEAWLRRRYVDDGATLAEIAAEVGCSYKAIERARDRYGIPRQGWRPKTPGLGDMHWLRRQLDAGRSQQDIADELGCSRSAVAMALLRSRS